MTLSICRAQPSEKGLIIQLSRHFSGDFLEYVVDYWIDREPGGMYLAREGNLVVACCTLFFPSPGQAWLQGMRVHPSFQRLGIGLQLTSYLMGEAQSQGAERVALVTAPDNLPAQQLALDLGFRPLGKTRKNFFYGGPKEFDGPLPLQVPWVPAGMDDLEPAWSYLVQSPVFQESDMYIFHPEYAFVLLDRPYFAELLARGEVWLLTGPLGLMGCLIVGRGGEAGHLCVRHLDIPEGQEEAAVPLLARLIHLEDTAFFSAGLLDRQFASLYDFFEGHLTMDDMEHWTVMERKY